MTDTLNHNYIIDSHCHLNYKGLNDDVKAVICRANDRNVQLMLAINTKIKEFDEVHQIALENDCVYATVGVHPHEAENEQGIALDALLERAQNPKIVGIGETGLDYYYDNAPRDLQRENFRTHIHAAQETGLPLIVHTREAEGDTWEIMSEEMTRKPYTGVIHCFTASTDFAQKALSLGFYISLSGIVTFKSAKDLQDSAKIIPLDKLLVETDAPFLAPVPNRGKTCEPAFVADTLTFLSDHLNVPAADLMQKTSENFFKLFTKIPADIVHKLKEAA